MGCRERNSCALHSAAICFSKTDAMLKSLFKKRRLTSNLPRPQRCSALKIRISSWVLSYHEHSKDVIENPTVYAVTSVLALLCAIAFVVNLFVSYQAFWSSLYNQIICGWVTALLVMSSLWQIKLVRKLCANKVLGLFLFGAAGFLYWDAHHVVVETLATFYPFEVSQLSEAISTGTFIVLGLDYLTLGRLAGAVWIVVTTHYVIVRLKEKKKIAEKWLTLSTAGVLLAMIILSGFGNAVSKSVGLKVALLRGAYEWDFTGNYRCPGIKDTKVLLSKMSDDVGYAANLNFPERGFFQFKKTDKELIELLNQSSHITKVTCNTSPSATAP